MPKKLSRQGHRQRLRDDYIKRGAGGMPIHNVLELLLTYSIPRRDVKDVVYSLYNYFDGDISKIFSADCDTLAGIDGIGENTAVLIKLFGDIPQYIADNRQKIRQPLRGYADAKKYMKDTFSCDKEEGLYEISIDNSGMVICVNFLQGEVADAEALDMLKIIENALKNKASSIMLVKVKKGSNCEPDEGDRGIIERVRSAFSSLEIRFDDYFVCAGEKSFSASNDIRFVRYFLKK